MKWVARVLYFLHCKGLSLPLDRLWLCFFFFFFTSNFTVFFVDVSYVFQQFQFPRAQVKFSSCISSYWAAIEQRVFFPALVLFNTLSYRRYYFQLYCTSTLFWEDPRFFVSIIYYSSVSVSSAEFSTFDRWKWEIAVWSWISAGPPYFSVLMEQGCPTQRYV